MAQVRLTLDTLITIKNHAKARNFDLTTLKVTRQQYEELVEDMQSRFDRTLPTEPDPEVPLLVGGLRIVIRSPYPNVVKRDSNS